MHLFFLREPIEVAYHRASGDNHLSFSVGPPGSVTRSGGGEPQSGGAILLESPVGGRLTEDTLHMAINREFFEAVAEHFRRIGRPGSVKMIPAERQPGLIEALGLPARIGRWRTCPATWPSLEEQVAALRTSGEIRIAVINMFNPAYGDTILSLAAFREIHARLRPAGGEVRLDLFQHPKNLETEALYLSSGLVHAIHHLPVPVARLGPYDAYFDISSERLRSDIHWLDAFLENVAIAPQDVPSARKRNRLEVAAEPAAELGPLIADLRREGKPLLLFHPRASTSIRAFPPELARETVEAVLDRLDCIAITAVPVESQHPRLVDLSRHSRSFQHFTYLISQADMFICADTCVYHVADAFDVPGVAVFTSIEPAFRTAYYPFVEGVLVARSGNRLLGTHWSEDPDDVAHAHEIWSRFDVEAILRALHAARRRRERASRRRAVRPAARATPETARNACRLAEVIA